MANKREAVGDHVFKGRLPSVTINRKERLKPFFYLKDIYIYIFNKSNRS